jgi:hypothetical protein
MHSSTESIFINMQLWYSYAVLWHALFLSTAFLIRHEINTYLTVNHSYVSLEDKNVIICFLDRAIIHLKVRRRKAMLNGRGKLNNLG